MLHAICAVPVLGPVISMCLCPVFHADGSVETDAIRLIKQPAVLTWRIWPCRQKSPGSAQHLGSTSLALAVKGIDSISWAATPSHLLAAACSDASIKVSPVK